MTVFELGRLYGIPYSTLRAVLTKGRQPTPAVAARIAAAIEHDPTWRLGGPDHTDTIRALWGNHNSDDIGLRCEPQISGARVRAVAKRLGLPAGGTRARKQAAE